MLISLYIQSFGLIEQAEIAFDAGLNVLSGETGAGKSIILEGLKTALGGRAQTEMIKTNHSRAVVQATLDCSKLERIQTMIRNQGLEDQTGENSLLIMSRELNSQGRHLCRINGRLVNLGLYREIAAACVDLHGQHQQQSLLWPDKQLELLDDYGGPQLLALKSETESAYQLWQKHRRLRQNSVAGERERQQRLDTINYQIQEIDAAELAAEEEQTLRQRRSVLANAEKIRLLLDQVQQLIYTGSAQQAAAIDLLGQARVGLEELHQYLPLSRPWQENIYSALCLVEETGRDLASQREEVEINPEELNLIEERLALIEKLKRKYGENIAQILVYREQIYQESEELEKMETDALGLDQHIEQYRCRYQELARHLKEKRIVTAQHLSAQVTAQLHELAMPHVQFSITVQEAPPGPGGSDQVEFLISPNVGEPMKPLNKIASGGELSRVLLAVKSTLAGEEGLCTLVFDEIDAGVGGRTLQVVAEKLAQLAQHKQVICVTHGAAVAAYAAVHYLIEKNIVDSQTVTVVRRLEGEERIGELSRMLGGDAHSRNLVQHVRKMIKH